MQRLINNQTVEVVSTLTQPFLLDLTAQAAIPTSLPASARYTTPRFFSTGMPRLTASAISTQVGSFTATFCLDLTGHIPVFTATAALAANSPAVLDVAPATIWQSVALTVSNDSASPATLSGATVVLSDTTGAGSFLGARLAGRATVAVTAA